MVLLSLTFASITIPAHSHLSLAFFFHCLTPIFLKSFITSSSHLSLSLPVFLFPSGLPSRIYYRILLLSILRTCPSHSILPSMILVTMSGLLHRLSSSLLHLIHHVPCMLTEPYILCKIFLQDMKVAVDFSVSVQVSQLKRTAG
jgi:hypothetical protein